MKGEVINIFMDIVEPRGVTIVRNKEPGFRRYYEISDDSRSRLLDWLWYAYAAGNWAVWPSVGGISARRMEK